MYSCLTWIVVLVVFLVGRPVWAQVTVRDLYVGQAITTGQMEENRGPAFAQCLIDVLVKVSGDPRLASDPRVVEEAGRAAFLVRSFQYRDRLEGKPIHDEQGTRDRPHDITVEFEPKKIDTLLVNLGRKPWGESRPRLVILLSVRIAGNDYILASNEDRGRDQREAFMSASKRIGVPVVLPSLASLAEENITPSRLRAAGAPEFDRLARLSGGDLVLIGDMEFSDAELGWIAVWRLHVGGQIASWRIRGVNFDEAFRNALRGSAQTLSGNGDPE